MYRSVQFNKSKETMYIKLRSNLCPLRTGRLNIATNCILLPQVQIVYL